MCILTLFGGMVSDHAEVVVRYTARGRLIGELFGMPRPAARS